MMTLLTAKGKVDHSSEFIALFPRMLLNTFEVALCFEVNDVLDDLAEQHLPISK